MRPRLNQTQLAIALTQTVAPSLVFALLLASSQRPIEWMSLQVMFAVGVLASALGVAAALWARVRITWVMSAVLLGVGAISMALMTIAATPTSDPALFMTGEWESGPLSLSAGWDRYLMSLLMVASGVTLPLALRPGARSLELLGLTVARLCLWYGALWQLSFLSFGGGFPKFLTQDTAALQLALLIGVSVGCVLLLRGDRRWLGALTAFDRSVVLSRFLVPLMLMPIVAAGLLVLASRHRTYTHGAALVLNAELNSIALIFVGLAALRSLWLERRRRSTLSKAVESSPVMIHSEDGVIEYWPRGCETLFGYTAEEAVGQRAPDLLKTEYPIPAAEIDATIRRTGEWAGELRQTSRDGRRLWVATRIALDRPEIDSGLKLVETMTDITELKRSNAALRDTEQSLEQVVAGYGVGMIDYWPLRGRTRFSPQMEHMLGLEPGGLGEDQAVWFSLVHPTDFVRVAALFAEDARRAAPERTVIFKVRHSDGAYRDLQGVLRYEYEAAGRLSRIAGAYMDVTEVVRDRIEMADRGARLLELQTELAHTSRLSAMGELAAGLAHELNQPLAAVGNSVGAIEMILRNDTDSTDPAVRQKLLRAARHAESQTVRAGEIVRRLREFITRSDADTQIEDLAELVDDALALVLPKPAAVGVELIKAIDPAARKVLADRIQVQQVLINLIRNAVEAMAGHAAPGVLRLSAEACDGMALVRVIDNGPGVTSERMATLFAPFVTSKRDGMGVGLSISRRIIESHGGKLWFEPAEGLGAAFHLTLPLAAVDSAAETSHV